MISPNSVFDIRYILKQDGGSMHTTVERLAPRKYPFVICTTYKI